MNVSEQELEKIQMHVGIHTGYRRIEKGPGPGLMGSKRFEDEMRPMPRYSDHIKEAGAVFQYLSSPLLHDLNRMDILLETWGEKVHKVPYKALKELIDSMEDWIVRHGGKP